MHEKILQILKSLKGEYFDVKDNLITDGYISSFDLLALIDLLEREFDISIPVERITPEQFNSVDGILNIITDIRGQ